MFARPTADDPLTQGDLIDDCPLVALNTESSPIDLKDPPTIRESLIDLRDVHSVPRAVLTQLIGAGKRIGSVISPYREHLAQHFAVTYMRVALPEPYPTQP